MKRALLFLLHAAVWRSPPPVAEGFLSIPSAARSSPPLGGGHQVWPRARAAERSGGVAHYALGAGGASPKPKSAAWMAARDATDLAMVELRREGLTLQEIGDRYGVTRERVRQRLKRVGVTGQPNRASDAQVEEFVRIYLAAPFVVPDDAPPAEPRRTLVRYDGGEFDVAMRHVEARMRELGLSSIGVVRRMREWSRQTLGYNLATERRRGQHTSIARAVRGGAALADVARSHGVSTNCAREAAVREGALPKVRSRTRKFRGENAEKALVDAEIAERLARGEAQNAIAAALSISQPYVSKRARIGRVLPIELDSTIRARLAAGAPQRTISAELGVSESWLSRRVALARLREPPDDASAAGQDGQPALLAAGERAAGFCARAARRHAAAAATASSSPSTPQEERVAAAEGVDGAAEL